MASTSQLWQAFCGGTYLALSPTISAEQAVNVYLETRTVPGSPKMGTFYGTPGLALEDTVSGLGCRGWFTQDGQTWVVVGNVLYERDAVGVFTNLGTIADDGYPVSWACNGIAGEQLAICGGDTLYVLDLQTNVLTTVALPFSEPVMLAFIDGYGLILQRDSPIVWFTALEDFTDVDALDFFTRSGTSDNIVAIASTTARVWCLGSATSTQFYDSGDADTPFLPYPGTVVQTGIVNPWALAVYEDQLCWIAQSANGGARVVVARDGAPQGISTPPIELFLSQCSTLADAEVMVYGQAGHVFVLMTCPSSPDAIQTYGYDLAEQLWHARAGWDDVHGVWTRWRARGCTTTADGTVLVGDYATGDLCTLDLDAYDDNGEILRRMRQAPYLSDSNQYVFVNAAELGMQAGVGLVSGQGSDPAVGMEISRDGTRTWVSAGAAGLGPIGEYGARAMWKQLGRVRADLLGIRIVQTDPVKCVWGPGMWLRLTPGTGKL